MTGLAIRVNQALSGPTLITYDSDKYRAQIAKLPSCRAIYEFCNLSSITKDDSNRVSQVNDLGPNALHLTATGDDRPTLVSGAVAGSFPAVYFDGTNKLQGEFFSGAERITVAISLLATGSTDSTSRVFLSDAGAAQPNWICTSTQLRMLTTDVIATISSPSTTFFQPKFTLDGVAAVGRIYPSTGTTNSFDALTRPKPSGAGNVGHWDDAAADGNNYIGYVGHMVVLDEDVTNNPAVNTLLDDYFQRLFRLI